MTGKNVTRKKVRRPRTAALTFVAIVAVIATACGSADRGSESLAAPVDAAVTPCDPDTAPVAGELYGGQQIASTAREDVPSALDSRSNDAFPEPLLDASLIVSGGPPPDGIPAVDEPIFQTIAETDEVADNEPVLVLEVNGDARAYPLAIMIWHELVNDTVGCVPITISFCPLCNSAIAYDRRVGDRILDFGTSGSLYQSSLVMYDRQTESLWTHFDGAAVIGALAGTELEILPMSMISYADFVEANPDGLVLSRDTGNTRSYGTNPYVGYESQSAPIGSFITEDIDGRLPAKERVVGVRDDHASVAVLQSALVESNVVPFALGDQELVAWLAPGTSSALDTAAIDSGADVGATGVFVPLAADGTELTFTFDGDAFVDDQTGTRWNILGEAVEGPLAGEQLESIARVDTFWFAWGTFQPDTTIIGG